MAKQDTFDDVSDFIEAALSLTPDIPVVIAIPSHDRNDEPIKDQDQWASSALELFGTMFHGATAFSTHCGIFRDENGELLRDKPIIVESLATREEIENRDNLKRLAAFAQQMAEGADQKSVFVSIDNARHYIERKKRTKA
ncbi:MAG: hypothetical protein HZA51_08560 [Planctomycetes bacterium]|nr:hypothetical protein [Planctomycetota bacterium]